MSTQSEFRRITYSIGTNRISVTAASEPDDPSTLVGVDELETGDLDPSAEAPEPTSMIPPTAFRCEKCGATFQDEGSLIEHSQHCPSRQEEEKATLTKNPAN